MPRSSERELTSRVLSWGAGTQPSRGGADGRLVPFGDLSVAQGSVTESLALHLRFSWSLQLKVLSVPKSHIWGRRGLVFQGGSQQVGNTVARCSALVGCPG